MMYMLLTQAPVDRLLQLVRTDDPALAGRLKRMGFSAETRFMRLEEEVMLRPVRVRGPGGDVVLGAGMAGKVVVHLDDGRKVPVAEMKRGESGHIEGGVCGTALHQVMKVFRLEVDARITFLREVPPMDYIVLVKEDARRVRIPEGVALKILGRSDQKPLQFCMSPTGRPFVVAEIMGGQKARQAVLSYGIAPGNTLIPESVSPGQNLYIGKQNPVVISTTDGLRLFLEECQACRIWVRESA